MAHYSPDHGVCEEDLGKTVRVGGSAEEDLGKTIRVGGSAEEDLGKTVRVGGKNGDHREMGNVFGDTTAKTLSVISQGDSAEVGDDTVSVVDGDQTVVVSSRTDNKNNDSQAVVRRKQKPIKRKVFSKGTSIDVVSPQQKRPAGNYGTGKVHSDREVVQEIKALQKKFDGSEETATFYDIADQILGERESDEKVNYRKLGKRVYLFLMELGEVFLRNTLKADKASPDALIFFRYFEEICFYLAESIKDLPIGKYQGPGGYRYKNEDMKIDDMFYFLWKKRISSEGIPPAVIKYWEEQFIEGANHSSNVQLMEAWCRKWDDRSVIQRALFRVLTRIVAEEVVEPTQVKAKIIPQMEFISPRSFFGNKGQDRLVSESMQRSPAQLDRNSLASYLSKTDVKVEQLCELVLPEGLTSIDLCGTDAFISGIVEHEKRKGNNDISLIDVLRRHSLDELAGSESYGCVQSSLRIPEGDPDSSLFRQRMSVRSMVWQTSPLEEEDAEYLFLAFRNLFLQKGSLREVLSYLFPDMEVSLFMRSSKGKYVFRQLIEKINEAANLLQDEDQESFMRGLGILLEKSTEEEWSNSTIPIKDAFHDDKEREFSYFQAVQLLAHNARYEKNHSEELSVQEEYDKRWKCLDNRAEDFSVEDACLFEGWVNCQRDIRMRVINDLMTYLGYRVSAAESRTLEEARSVEMLLKNVEALGSKMLTLMFFDSKEGPYIVRWPKLKPLKPKSILRRPNTSDSVAAQKRDSEEVESDSVDFNSLDGTYFDSKSIIEVLDEATRNVRMRVQSKRISGLPAAKSYRLDEDVLNSL